jgi:hypothetical protein
MHQRNRRVDIFDVLSFSILRARAPSLSLSTHTNICTPLFLILSPYIVLHFRCVTRQCQPKRIRCLLLIEKARAKNNTYI